MRKNGFHIGALAIIVRSENVPENVGKTVVLLGKFSRGDRLPTYTGLRGIVPREAWILRGENLIIKTKKEAVIGHFAIHDESQLLLIGHDPDAETKQTEQPMEHCNHEPA